MPPEVELSVSFLLFFAKLIGFQTVVFSALITLLSAESQIEHHQTSAFLFKAN